MILVYYILVGFTVVLGVVTLTIRAPHSGCDMIGPTSRQIHRLVYGNVVIYMVQKLVFR